MEVCTNELHLHTAAAMRWNGVPEDLHHPPHPSGRDRALLGGQTQVERRCSCVLRISTCKKWLGPFLRTLQPQRPLFIGRLTWKNQGCSCQSALHRHPKMLKRAGFCGVLHAGVQFGPSAHNADYWVLPPAGCFCCVFSALCCFLFACLFFFQLGSYSAAPAELTRRHSSSRNLKCL